MFQYQQRSESILPLQGKKELIKSVICCKKIQNVCSHLSTGNSGINQEVSLSASFPGKWNSEFEV